MCEERRSMVTKADLQGDEPKTVWSLTFSNMKLIMFLIVVVGAIWGAAGWMTATAQNNFDNRLSKELIAPDGSVYKSIYLESHRAINESQALTREEAKDIYSTIDLMKRQDVRSNQMLERVYMNVTGESPTPRILE